ncbi:unnamed protein product, partial [Closterium sp. Naga37s-1]
MTVDPAPLAPSPAPPSAAVPAQPATGPGAAEQGGPEAEGKGSAAAAEKGTDEAWGPKGEAAGAEGEEEEGGEAAGGAAGTAAAAAAAAAAAVAVKHPLQQRWTLWFDNPHQRGKSGGWGTSMRLIYSFGTAEDFWSLYNNVTSAATLPPRMDMHLFKEGIVPKWEDPQCEKGGSWTVFCRTKDMFDHVWLNVLLALIGEQFTEAGDICGVAANARPNKDRVVLWTKTASNEAVQVSIGRQLKEISGILDKISYSSFVSPHLAPHILTS